MEGSSLDQKPGARVQDLLRPTENPGILGMGWDGEDSELAQPPTPPPCLPISLRNSFSLPDWVLLAPPHP